MHLLGGELGLTSTCLSTSLRGSVADSISSVWKAPLTGRGVALMKWRCLEFCWRKSRAWKDNTDMTRGVQSRLISL